MIAVVGGTDEIAIMHVVNLLRHKGIKCISPGQSVGCGFEVRTKDVTEAVKVLEQDARKNPYPIIITGSTYEFEPPKPKVVKVGRQIRTLDDAKSASHNPSVVAVLAALVKVDRDPDQPVGTVVRIEMRLRRYFDDGLRWQKGYDCMVYSFSLRDGPKSEYVCLVQVWNGGKSVQVDGGLLPD